MTESEYDSAKLESILGKVRGLLATADHPNTPIEMAENYRTQAEALMFKYRLDEATASGYSGEGEGGLKPVWRKIALTDYGSEFSHYYRDLAGTAAYHVGARSVTKREHNPALGKHEIVMDAVGYESDLRFMDLILTAALLEFSKRLEPSFDQNLTVAENIYNMRHAGMERKRIAKIVFGDWKTENEMKAKNRKVTNLFKEESLRRGEDPMTLLGRGNNMITYRASYADGFVTQFYLRLQRMRQAHGAEDKGLVLMSRKENVDEAFYEKYEHLRPVPVNPDAEPIKVKVGKPRKFKPRPFNDKAYDRGADAARAVDLGKNATGTSRMRSADKKELD